MAAFNVSLDDSSPLITYSPLGAWLDTPSNDTQASSYNSQSLHTTSSQGASAIFVFNGTGVWLYGGLRSNYGPYTFSVDGKVITTGTAKNDGFQANQLLGGKSDLAMGEHTAVLRCESGSPIDLDNIIFQTQVSHASGPVNANTVQDNASNITYSPSDAWTESKGDIFSGGTVRHTDKEAATASMKFTGDAVAVYGGSSFDHGEYIVDIDGRKRALNGGGDGQSRVYHPQTLIYFATDLGGGTHDLTITSRGQGKTLFFDLDSITVYEAEKGPATGHVLATEEDSKEESKGLNGGAIAGIIISIILVIFIIVGLFFARKRYRRKRRDLERSIQEEEKRPDGLSPVFPLQNPDLESRGDYDTDYGIRGGPMPSFGTTMTSQAPYMDSFESGNPGGPQRTGTMRSIGLPAGPTKPQAAAVLNRSKTNRTSISRYSQGSYDSDESEDFEPREIPPPVPPIPPLNIKKGVSRHRPTSSISSTDSLGSLADYYRTSVTYPEPAAYRDSIGNPLRPSRPASVLDLRGTEFDEIHL